MLLLHFIVAWNRTNLLLPAILKVFVSNCVTCAEFISRHAMDGKFTFIDQRVSHVLAYSPQELLAKSCFDFFHPEDQTHMKESFDQGRQPT